MVFVRIQEADFSEKTFTVNTLHQARMVLRELYGVPVPASVLSLEEGDLFSMETDSDPEESVWTGRSVDVLNLG